MTFILLKKDILQFMKKLHVYLVYIIFVAYQMKKELTKLTLNSRILCFLKDLLLCWVLHLAVILLLLLLWFYIKWEDLIRYSEVQDTRTETGRRGLSEQG